MSKLKCIELVTGVIVLVASVIGAIYGVQSYKLQKKAFDRDNPALVTHCGYWMNTHFAPGGEAAGVLVEVVNYGRQTLAVSEVNMRFKNEQGSSGKIEMKAEGVKLGQTLNLARGEGRNFTSDKLTNAQIQSIEQSGEIIVTDVAGGEMTAKYSAIRILRP